MLKIFKTSAVEKKIKKVKRLTVDSWIELTTPTKDEIDKVVEKTLVDKDLILKMLDDEERPRIEQSGNAILIVIDTPYLEKDENGSNYKTYPFGIIVTENNYLITVSPKRIELLNDFKKNKIKDFRTAKKTRFLIQILLRTSNYYLRALKQVYNDMEEKEKVLKKSTENKDLIDLLEIEKTLVYFITSLKANDAVLEKLSKGTILPLYEGDLDLLEDAIIENKQAIEMTDIYSNILSSTMDFFASVISNNLNIVMKVLASVTILMAIPTIIGGIFGMNVALPLQDNPQGFIIIIFLTIILTLITAFILYKKDMFS